MNLGNSEEVFFEKVLFTATGISQRLARYELITGGDVNNAVLLVCENSNYFLKWQEQDAGDMFSKEAKGLETLKAQTDFRIPNVLSCGIAEGRSYLLLEHLPKGNMKPDFWEIFAQQLAAQHQVNAAASGLDYDNFIGKLPQSNGWQSRWLDFFIEKRLEVQISLAFYHQHIDKEFLELFRKIYAKLPSIIPELPASLLHGDLWSGNFLCDEGGSPCLIDPAIYYGSREMELAFTKLFGGFNASFYKAYENAMPLEPGFEDRVPIYNLYPLLVHVNMFGPSYLPPVKRLVNALVL